MKKFMMNKTFDKFFWWSFAGFILLVALVCLLPSILTEKGEPDFSDKGQIGDTIGGIMGPFVAIIAAWLTFIAFWVQFKANNQQRHDIAIERFESKLFEMMHIQQEITTGLLIEQIGSDVKPQRGRDVFQFVYETGQDMIRIGNEKRKCTLKEALSIDDSVKMSVSSMKNMWFLDHYFRHLYRIFKFIDESDDRIIDKVKKYEYTSIVRATLSQYELVMLFYNGFYHKKFKTLAEKYALMNNLRIGLLASDEDINLYGRKISEQYSFEDDRGKNMNLEYKKSAFVYSAIS